MSTNEILSRFDYSNTLPMITERLLPTLSQILNAAAAPNNGPFWTKTGNNQKFIRVVLNTQPI